MNTVLNPNNKTTLPRNPESRWNDDRIPVDLTAASRREPIGTVGLSPSPKALSDLRLFTMPEGGTDRLSFVVWDTIDVLGQVQDTVELRGHYIIERANPTSADWVTASVDIKMREMHVAGVSSKFGSVRASVNHVIGKPSQGQVKAGTLFGDELIDSPKMCVMEGYMQFELSDIPLKLFNKEAIVLQHNITHIPPIGQGGGTRDGESVDLYRVDDPDGPPVAILRRVKTHIGAWQVG